MPEMSVQLRSIQGTGAAAGCTTAGYATAGYAGYSRYAGESGYAGHRARARCAWRG